MRGRRRVRRLSLRHRHGKAEGSTASCTRLRPDAATLHLDEAAADGQPQTGALGTGADGRVGPVERLEDAVQILLWHAAPAIEHADDYRVTAAFGRDLDLRAGW